MLMSIKKHGYPSMLMSIKKHGYPSMLMSMIGPLDQTNDGVIGLSVLKLH